MTKRHATARRNDVPSAKTLPKMVPTEYTKALRWSKGLNSKTDMGNERAPLNKPVSVKLPTLTKISECLASETKTTIFYPSTSMCIHIFVQAFGFFSTTSSGTPCYQSFQFFLFVLRSSFICLPPSDQKPWDHYWVLDPFASLGIPVASATTRKHSHKATTWQGHIGMPQPP